MATLHCRDCPRAYLALAAAHLGIRNFGIKGEALKLDARSVTCSVPTTVSHGAGRTRQRLDLDNRPSSRGRRPQPHEPSRKLEDGAGPSDGDCHAAHLILGQHGVQTNGCFRTGIGEVVAFNLKPFAGITAFCQFPMCLDLVNAL